MAKPAPRPEPVDTAWQSADHPAPIDPETLGLLWRRIHTNTTALINQLMFAIAHKETR